MSHTLTPSTPSGPSGPPPGSSTGQPATDRRTLTRVCTAVLLGSALEWYDYFLYGAAAALVFGQVFFPTASESTSLLLSLATFGVGFVARPIGAMVFGHIGDKHGRRPALIATLMLMGLSTTAMALIPSHAMIGMAAPLLLVVLRLLQGMGSGAEYSGASVYAVEYAPPGRRGLFGSFSAAGVYLGLVLSSGALLLTTSLTTDAQFAAWGWRLPFLASLLLIALGLWIRLRLEETPAFEEATEDVAPAKAPLLTLVRTQWRSMLLVMGLVAAPLSFSHLYQVFALSYMADAGYDRVTGTTGLLVAGLVVMITAPLAGIASDRFGRRPVLMVGAVYAIAFAFPFFMLVDSGRPVLAMLALALAQGGSVGIMFGVQGVILSELFSTASRYSGAAVSREFAAIIFGGFAPLIAVSLAASANGASWPVGIYVVVLAADHLRVGAARPGDLPDQPLRQGRGGAGTRGRDGSPAGPAGPLGVPRGLTAMPRIGACPPRPGCDGPKMTRAPRHRVLLGLLASALALGTALVPSASVACRSPPGAGHGTPARTATVMTRNLYLGAEPHPDAAGPRQRQQHRHRRCGDADVGRCAGDPARGADGGHRRRDRGGRPGRRRPAGGHHLDDVRVQPAQRHDEQPDRRVRLPRPAPRRPRRAGRRLPRGRRRDVEQLLLATDPLPRQPDCDVPDAGGAPRRP